MLHIKGFILSFTLIQSVVFFLHIKCINNSRKIHFDCLSFWWMRKEQRWGHELVMISIELRNNTNVLDVHIYAYLSFLYMKCIASVYEAHGHPQLANKTGRIANEWIQFHVMFKIIEGVHYIKIKHSTILQRILQYWRLTRHNSYIPYIHTGRVEGRLTHWGRHTYMHL